MDVESLKSYNYSGIITFLIRNPILEYWGFFCQFEIDSIENDSILQKTYSILDNVISCFKDN